MEQLKQQTESEVYQPTLMSIMSNNDTLLELYIDTSNDQTNIVVEMTNAAKNISVKDVFYADLHENT